MCYQLYLSSYMQAPWIMTVAPGSSGFTNILFLPQTVNSVTVGLPHLHLPSPPRERKKTKKGKQRGSPQSVHLARDPLLPHRLLGRRGKLLLQLHLAILARRLSSGGGLVGGGAAKHPSSGVAVATAISTPSLPAWPTSSPGTRSHA